MGCKVYQIYISKPSCEHSALRLTAGKGNKVGPSEWTGRCIDGHFFTFDIKALNLWVTYEEISTCVSVVFYIYIYIYIYIFI